MTDTRAACAPKHLDSSDACGKSNDRQLLQLCRAEDVRRAGSLRVEPAGVAPLAVFHADDSFFVTEDACSHGDASLSEGMVSDGQVECPWHSGAFCLRTGEPTAFPAVLPIRVYPVSVKDGFICIARPVPDDDVYANGTNADRV
ncbi:Rieske (2Fe-2S) domain-containing protein [Caballeronia udeis]|uniref:Rieske (2Fe-2S) domain-containing protein n=1 Tax=Caballeronia udeis TaxID=1232866 RepID=A0A158JIF1_9BURK|nr:non-heme iron oxygenase ferredoxin subunit [Caballeronia udeis]SAL68657.1 Rieske (2Fe-2S) domain-containing protein [Caballeronia udeis]